MNQGLVRPNESPKRPASTHSERQGKTWHSLTEIYGARWIRENGDAPGRVWSSMINALTDAQIATALGHLVKNPRKDGRGNIHPPSAPEFYEAAKVGTPRFYPAVEDQSRDLSNFAKGANKVLLYIMMGVGGIGKEHLAALRKEQDKLVKQFELIATEEEVEWKMFIETVDERLRSLLKKLRSQSSPTKE